MKVLQILPELNSGGVERGTFEIGRHLVKAGHQALVVSNGGRMVASLEAAGIRHITMAVHKKRIGSIFKIGPFRKLLAEEKPDILHMRSRLPAWIAWLAWRKMNPQTRPRLVSTVHGFYSVNGYSAVMMRGERIIGVSESIRSYILKNFPQTAAEKIRVIHRGVSPEEFPRGYQPDAKWLETWRREQPQLDNKAVLLMPGRMSRWKGQEIFLQLIADLQARGRAVHGVLAGDTHPKKRAYLEELRSMAAHLNITNDVTFLGHRNDLRDVMAMSDVVYSLSTDPEAFGRVSLEAMAIGRKVIGFNHGGVGEQLKELFPAGAVPLGDTAALVEATLRLLDGSEMPLAICPPFTQAAMCEATMEVYQSLLASPR